jgi:hypothetical protein
LFRKKELGAPKECGADRGWLSATRFRDVTDGTSNTIAIGEIAFEIGGWGRGAISAGPGGGGDGGGGGSQGFGRAVVRWWKAAPACATPGMNPPETSCLGSVERRFQFSSRHPGGCNFTLPDGSARFVSETVDLNVFKGVITRDGGEVVGQF